VRIESTRPILSDDHFENTSPARHERGGVPGRPSGDVRGGNEARCPPPTVAETVQHDHCENAHQRARTVIRL